MVMLVGVDDVTSRSVGASETGEERGALLSSGHPSSHRPLVCYLHLLVFIEPEVTILRQKGMGTRDDILIGSD